MKYRKLRIAWSIAWVLLCLLPIAVCVRSYIRWDSPVGPFAGRHIQFNSLRGRIFVGWTNSVPPSQKEWMWRVFPVGVITDAGVTDSIPWPFTWKIGALGFGVVQVSNERFVCIPYWFLAAVPAALAAAPWLRWRFSLRTLLIATTVAAIGLGLIGYVFRT